MTSVEPSSTGSHSILLVNPPSPLGFGANREGAGGLGAWSDGEHGFLYPPQTLAYCAAVMRAGGWRVTALDAAGERISAGDALRRLAVASADVIAVLVAHTSLDNDVAFLNELRAARDVRVPRPRTRLLAIGAVMDHAAPILLERTDVDHVIAGEPEGMLAPACRGIVGESAARSLRRLVTPADLSSAGVNADGRVADLDALPPPAWDLTPWRSYGFLTISTSRGCDDACAFCPYVVGQGRHARARAAAGVVEEMAWLAAAFQPRRVIVRDPVFAHSRERVERICHGMIERKVRLAWECESRPEHFDRELLRLLRQAGCTTIKLGVETTSEAVLRRLRRLPADGSAAAYIQHTADVAAACRALGIACRLFVMTGLPGQTDADVEETIAFIRSARPSGVHVKAFHRYPGLPLAAGDIEEEQRRGERQAQMIEHAARQIAAANALTPLQAMRRWLRGRTRV
jgi:radical SAM superfamily enzyme YgiQ (UPF0313 family)